MNYIRKRLVFILIALTLTIIPVINARAQSGVIYQTSTKETVTSGATLEKITRFTINGWFNINVLRVDLSNPNIKVDTLTNPNCFYKLSTVQSLAESRGAIAAVNSSFFSWMTEAGSGYADGPIVESGKLISAVTDYNRYNESMGSFSIDNQDQILYNFWKTKINLVASNGVSVTVGQYNKPSKDYTDFTIFDRRWSNSSVGVSAAYPDISEVVVDNGIITEIRNQLPAVEIPENGYVIITREKGAKIISGNFRVGDNINLSITNPDLNSLKVSMTGGAILVKDGSIPNKFSINISGKNPRTAVGSTKDGKQLILVTVDGSENFGIGMDQTDMANLMLELGAYNALNFDGGGSTTMVARHPGDTDVSLINKPSDGSQRKVAAALGVFSAAPPSSLGGLIIDADDDRVFVNTSRDLTIKGIDSYFNPVTVDPSQVIWSVSGVQGVFSGNTFYPKSEGEAKIKATVGNISSEFSIRVVSSPVNLKLNTKTAKLPLNGSKSFSITGESKDGYTIKINPLDVKWTVNGNIGSFSGPTFKATTSGTGYIDASLGNVHAYCAVAVASESSSLKDNFEQSNGTFLTSPADLGGAYCLYSTYAHSGTFAGKLTYNFTDTAVTGTRAAYMVYPNNGLSLDANTTKLGLWVYNTHENPNWLRAEVYDTSGSKHFVDFAKNMDWTGWKYVEASLQDINSPNRVTKIYMVQVNAVYDSGDVYFDDLTQITSTYPGIDTKNIPQDTVYTDPANTSVTSQKGDNSLRFAILGQSRKPKNLLEKLLSLRFSENVNSNCDAAAFLCSSATGIEKSITKPYVSTNTGYKSFDIKNSRLIQLDMSKNGLRLSNPDQWSWFFDQLNFSGDNIFVFLTGSPDNFSDSKESNLFKDTLIKKRESAGKNIWVFYKGDSNSSYMENGIRYLETSRYDIDGLTPGNADSSKYLLVTVKDKNVTFEFKPVI